MGTSLICESQSCKGKNEKSPGYWLWSCHSLNDLEAGPTPYVGISDSVGLYV